MGFFLSLKNFFFVLKCPSCGESLPLGREGRGVLCEECASKWQECKQTVCSECGNVATSCRCMPPLMKKAGVHTLLKLGFYGAESTAIVKTVLYMKDIRDKRVFSFVADELCRLIDSFFEEQKMDPSEAVFTFLPRGRKNLQETGFDQAEILSKLCARRYGAVFVKAVRRKMISKMQKGLGNDGRLKNARASLRAANGIDLKGRTVVLVDDVTTSGASFAVGARCLKSLGAKRVICLSVTKTFEKNE